MRATPEVRYFQHVEVGIIATIPAEDALAWSQPDPEWREVTVSPVVPQGAATPADEALIERLRAEVADLRENPRDEYHSMRELYDYRMLYNAHAAHGWLAAGIPVVKSWRHSDGEECFGGGWFIVTATLPTGQVSNHYKAEHWDLFRVPEVDLPPAYDGHTPADAADRLLSALYAYQGGPYLAASPADADTSPTPTVEERWVLARSLSTAARKCAVYPKSLLHGGESDLFDMAGVVLKSDWLSAHNADTAERIAQAIEAAVREYIEAQTSAHGGHLPDRESQFAAMLGQGAHIARDRAAPPVAATSEGVSGYTGHGHRIPGVVQIGKPVAFARCGGPGMCADCTREAAAATGEQER